MIRKFPKSIKRIVVKIGSRSVADDALKPKKKRLRALIKQINQLHQEKVEVVLVSSGAIVLGQGEVSSGAHKKDIASLQAFAAVGQTVLMRTYDDLFHKADMTCAQVLLTWDDFDQRLRRNNARKTLEAILSQKIVPVINENDTIATDEIKFGDNDKLSAFVASLIHADLLILLSDVEGFYENKNGLKKVFKEVKEITREIEALASGPQKGQMSKGGMTAKLEAVKIASHAKIPCVIADSEAKDVLIRIFHGEPVGTLFLEKEEKLLARKHWISFVAKPKGVLIVDDGAKRALLKRGRSLLLPGVVKGDGHFKKNDVVVICDESCVPLARGIINYSSSDLQKWLGTEDKQRKKEVIHCDNLVLDEK